MQGDEGPHVPPPTTQIEIGLNAAIVAVHGESPVVLVVPHQGEPDPRDALPFGPFDPLAHRTMEIGLRSWVAEQTSLKLGYVEQLYTFGDRGRHARPGDETPHVMSVGYLALTRIPEDEAPGAHEGWRFEDCYAYFPWEDWRQGRPGMLDSRIIPALEAWLEDLRPRHPAPQGFDRRDRFALAFGLDGHWDEERVLDRYELLYEAGLIEEARADGREIALCRPPLDPPLGRPMRFDHRRILATAMGRLRAKLKYRPVIFELMAPDFTLTELQHTVEAIAGRHVHKQNFRRFVEQAALVEATGDVRTTTGGRPARLFRFRREVVRERPSPGVRFGARG